MTKKLVIAEKPDMGRNIAAAIEPRAVNHRTYLEGEHYIITWAIGHLVSLAEPDHYDTRYKRWNIDHLPIIPQSFKLLAQPRTRSQLQVIRELANRSSSLVNACDAGREGQYIFHLIQTYLKLKHPVERLWISDLTAETIRDGFSQLQPASHYANLTEAAKSRSEADWLIGMNATRAFTVKHDVLLSVGRVQTPVLALICDRQRDIDAFESTTYYEVQARFTQGKAVSYNGTWQGERLLDRKQAEQIADRTREQDGHIRSCQIKESKEFPPKLYDLTLLQREANRRFSFGAKKTLDLAQSLYEKHKLISYPRTNSNYVTEANIAQMQQTLSHLHKGAYQTLATQADPARVHAGNKMVCNPAKVEDHHAILPTNKSPGSLQPDEQRLYDLIVRRFLAQFFPPAVYKNYDIHTAVGDDVFRTKIKEQQSPGWKITEEAPKKRSTKNDEEPATEEIQTRMTPFEIDPAQPHVHAKESNVIEKETQPPKNYTEGTLLQAMESAGKQVDDEQLREAMKDQGLGTPATRAAIIERLKQVGYIDMQGKSIQPTLKGKTAVQVIRAAGVELLASPEMTGQWERRLHQISRGQAKATDFMDKVRQFATHVVVKVRAQQAVSAAAFGESNQRSKTKGGKRKPSSATSSSKSTAAAATKSRTRTSTRTPATAKIAAAVSNLPAGAISPCPRSGCDGYIIVGRKGYGCTRYRDGCRFVIWKEAFGRTISESAVRSLLSRRQTQPLKLTGKDGRTYQARIVLNDNNTGELGLSFPDD